MLEVGAYEAKTNLSRLLEKVERGERITLTRHGRPVAMLVPVEDKRNPEDVISDLREFRRGRRLEGAGARTLVEEGRRV